MNTVVVASMIIELLLPSLVAGLVIALPAGSLGCFIVWRKMAFFSDALAHSAIMGTALALIMNIHPLYGLLGFGALIGLVMARFDTNLKYSGDTLLAIIAQISLAGGLVCLVYSPSPVNIESLLFGDILSIGWQHLVTIVLVSVSILVMLGFFWRQMVDTALDEELAAIEGIPVYRIKNILFLCLVALIAISVKMVGVLLISSLLLIPAATARVFSKTPLQMAILSPLIGQAGMLLGIAVAWLMNWPAGPAIVLALASLWLLAVSLKRTVY